MEFIDKIQTPLQKLDMWFYICDSIKCCLNTITCVLGSRFTVEVLTLQPGSGQDPVSNLVGMDQGSLYKSHHSCESIANSVEMLIKSKKEKCWPSC